MTDREFAALVIGVFILFGFIACLCGSSSVEKSTPKNPARQIACSCGMATPEAEIVRVTAYVPGDASTALCERARPGGTAAVSPACLGLLGATVYVEGFGVYEINDLTSAALDEKYPMCTVDLAVANTERAKEIGSSFRRVVALPKR